MSAPTAKGKLTGSEKLERELRARLGLDPSAAPEDVMSTHETVSAYLAAAPRDLDSWARTQAAGADEAYALLTDPAALARAVALVGAGARSSVLPGGPATPPAHRDTPAPAAAAAVPAAAAQMAGPMHLPGPLASKGFRNLALVGATVATIGIVAVVGYGFGGTSAGKIGASVSPAASPTAGAPVLDQAKVAELMARIQANPKDADTLMALGDEYYKVGDFTTAGNWFTKVTVLEPTNARGILALGATAFNSGDMDAAEVAWTKVLAIDGKNVEAHYDLGFLFFNKQPADLTGVPLHWNRVVELDPNSELSKTVKAHLGALASLAPASPAASAAPGAAPSGSPQQ